MRCAAGIQKVDWSGRPKWMFSILVREIVRRQESGNQQEPVQEDKEDENESAFFQKWPPY